MKIFVIIATYNGEKWIRTCLNSIRKSQIPCEIICIDNASSDATISIIENEYSEVILFKNKKNKGFGKANNIGINYALKNNCDFVFLLNQDAQIEDDTIINLVNFSLKHQQYGVLSPLHYEGKGEKYDYKFHKHSINPNREKLNNKVIEVEFVNAAAWLITRTCLEKVGGFHPWFFHYGEDENYLHRVKFNEFLIGIVKNCRILHDRVQNPVINESVKDMIQRYWRYFLVWVLKKKTK